MAKFTKEQIGDMEGGGTALALTGHTPFGDCQSIRYRLDAANAQIKKLTTLVAEEEEGLGSYDKYVVMWKRELAIWKYAVVEGEKLLKRELGRAKKEHARKEAHKEAKPQKAGRKKARPDGSGTCRPVSDRH